MFNFGATATNTTLNNTSLFGTSTPVNQNRTGPGLLFGSTPTQPSTLSSTPFGQSTLFGAASPSTTTLQAGSSGTGTIHKFDAVAGTDKINKNGIQTQIRTKLFNICAMPIYERKSTEELRLEDYIDNRKFPSTTTGLFPATSSAPSLFGGSSTPTLNPTTNTTNMFGATTATSSTLNSSLFGNKLATTTTSAPFSFGPTAATTTSTTAPFSFGATTTTPSPFGVTAPATGTTNAAAPFAFGGNPATSTAVAPAFSFGGTTSTAGSSFGFSVTKPATSTTFSFTTPTAASTAPTFSLFPTATTSAPTLFSTAAQPVQASTVLSTPSSVDTKTHLQLFQTMLNIQPFNSELGFLARNIKPNIGLDRARLRTAPDPTNGHPITNVFSSLIPKPSIIASSTSTPPSTLANPLPTHAHTLPSVLLPPSSSTASINLFGKRKLADSFLDDDDDNSLMMDDGPSLSINKISKTNAIKRPRVLDMNKVRSVVLGGGIQETIAKEETFSDTYIVKPTSDNLTGWKKFANYDAYLASKQQQQPPQPQPLEIVTKTDDDKQIDLTQNRFERERAFRLPILTHDDYYTKPKIDELRHYFNEKGQCFVDEFTVGREHYGSVTFQGSKMNLAGLDLNKLIEIGRREVTVYPNDNDKPRKGEELNCQAIISLLGVYPIDRSTSNRGEEVTDPDRLIELNYENYLCNMTSKFSGKFIDYDVYTGTWTFKVDHF